MDAHGSDKFPARSQLAFLYLAPVLNVPAVPSPASTHAIASPVTSPLEKDMVSLRLGMEAFDRKRSDSSSSGRFLVLNPVTADE